MQNIVKQIEEAKTPTEVIEWQLKVYNSYLLPSEKRPLLKLLDAQLALAYARIDLGEAYVEAPEIKEGDLK